MKRVFYVIFAVVTSFLVLNCTSKFPLPPKPGAPIPPESTYVFVERLEQGTLQDTIFDIEYGKDGALYALRKSGVEKFLPSLEWEAKGHRLSSGGPSRNIFVVGENMVKVFDNHGNLVDSIELPNFEGEITGFAVDDSGGMFIALKDPDMVVYIKDTVIDTLTTHGSGNLYVNEPEGLAYNDGILYIAVPGHNWVEGWEIINGQIVPYVHLGGLVQDPDTASGKFNRPVDVAVDTAGFIYVADSGNARVQVFRPDGSLLTILRYEEEGQFIVPIRVTVSFSGKWLFVLTQDMQILKFNRVEKPKPPENQGGGT